MSGHSVAKIISYNVNMVDICASAARISTTQGNAINIFNDAKSKTNNMELIEKVMKSGHESVLEHACFSIAFNEVSVFVEQYIIECRLASFTVKSRRYVNYSNQGCYIPPSLDEEETVQYNNYTQLLFEGYSKLIELGIPKEDARFLLPYSFCSNFYCTINARELLSLISSTVNGRGRMFPELVNLANQLISQIHELFPAMLTYFLEEQDGDSANWKDSSNMMHSYSVERLLRPEDLGKVEILQNPQKPLDILMTAWSVSEPNAQFDIAKILSSDRPRELEQLNYTFFIESISLVGITHLARHRMQSIIIPPLTHYHPNSFALPESIANNEKADDIYKSVIEKATEYRIEHSKKEKLAAFHYYYALSGNVMNVMTTINARELQHFIMLRACNRAQWEIRAISIHMLSALRNHFPLLFSHYGPSCVMRDFCPEGKLSCGQINQMKKMFSYRNIISDR